LGDRIEILEGLKPGERIAISGNFLIDSESRMKSATAGFAGKALKEPVCALDSEAARDSHASRMAKYQGKADNFCADTGQEHGGQQPTRAVTAETAKGHDDQVVSRQLAQGTAETVKDPVCGLAVDTGKAKQAGRTSDYQGKTYFFDTDGCKQRFDHNPQRYLSGSDTPLASSASLEAYPTVESVPNPLEQYRRKLRMTVTRENPRALPQLPVQKLLPQLPASGGSQEVAGPSAMPPETAQVKPQESPTPPLAPQTPQ
jgi:YHS domain-containing protein